MRVFVDMRSSERKSVLVRSIVAERHAVVSDPQQADVCLRSCDGDTAVDLESIRGLLAAGPQPVVAMVHVLDLNFMQTVADEGVFSFVRSEDPDSAVLAALTAAARAGACRPIGRSAPAPVFRSASAPPGHRHSGGELTTLEPARPSWSRTPMSVSVVIPAKNECQNLLWVLSRMPDRVDEVILVDGHSTDGTVEVARALRSDLVVIPDTRPGKGAALRAGLAIARGDVIVTMDADGSMIPAEITRMVSLIEEGFDFVKGSRFMAGGGSLDITPLRRAGNRFLVGLVNALWGANLTDLCYGFCAFRREALDKLALRSDGFEIETEMNIRALKANLAITETPSFESPRRFGGSNLRTFRDGSRVLRKILAETVSTRSAPPDFEAEEPRLLPLAVESSRLLLDLNAEPMDLGGYEAV